MIIDARTLPNRTVVETEICIIGAGPAGITLAREFDSQKFRVVLLEGGGLAYDRAGQALYRGENIGLAYEDLDEMRSRYFGGSSNCWGGFCRPLDPHDFETREWVPNSGWPFQRDELLPYYRRAQSVLQLGRFEYDPRQWEAWANRPDARFLPFDRNRAVSLVAQLSPPTRFGQIYGREIARSANVTAFLNANVTEIETPGHGRTVTGLQVRTLAGRAFQVVGKTYILATGGVENARLLLVSNRYQAGGVGNQNDVVGRYFMDHPRIHCSTIAFNDPKSFGKAYDLHVAFTGGMLANGTKISGFFGLSPETQRAERVANVRCYALSRFLGDNGNSYSALKQLYQIRHRPNMLRRRYRSAVADAIGNLPNIAILALGLKFKPRLLARGFTLETVVEPSPLPESRVTLGSERDALGLRQVKVDWRVGELEKRTVRRMHEILGEEMERIGAGTVKVQAPNEGDPWPDTLNGCWHHMGTTRMHTDPRYGVVDPTCRIHEMENLFIAGSSVFPTCGSDMPTLTITALALRLADHVKALFNERTVWDHAPSLPAETRQEVA